MNVALSWKETEISSAHSWIKEMAMCVTLEKLTYLTRGKAQQFEEMWAPLIDFLKK